VILHLPGWLQIGGITVVIGGLLSVAIHAHAANGALVTVGLSPRWSTLRTLAPLVIVAAAIVVLLALLNSSVTTPPSKAETPTRPHVVSRASSEAVVESFFVAINGHNWPRVWALGGKNLGNGIYDSYNGMISGYRCTARDVLVTGPAMSGDAVSGRFLAYESNGTRKAFQRFGFSYVVRRGVIISGHASLLIGRAPAGCD
jgi:hypothetical protein